MRGQGVGQRALTVQTRTKCGRRLEELVSKQDGMLQNGVPCKLSQYLAGSNSFGSSDDGEEVTLLMGTANVADGVTAGFVRLPDFSFLGALSASFFSFFAPCQVSCRVRGSLVTASETVTLSLLSASFFLSPLAGATPPLSCLWEVTSAWLSITTGDCERQALVPSSHQCKTWLTWGRCDRGRFCT